MRVHRYRAKGQKLDLQILSKYLYDNIKVFISALVCEHRILQSISPSMHLGQHLMPKAVCTHPDTV
jgi:hypothetical protein